ncbi:SAM-dependent methyltransferase [Amycolatopsis sp. NPDC101161]
MAAVFDGFTLIEPGIVPAGEWWPAAGTEIPDPKSVGLYAGVARKTD